VSEVQQYESDGNRSVRIKRLERFINTFFLHSSYRGGIVEWIKDYEDKRLGTMMKSRVVNYITRKVLA
jgi:hypothetical protein